MSEGGYRIGQTLGAGAVASVVEVTDADGRRYAGKLLHGSQQIDAAARLRFEQEAKLLEGLEHPNVVGSRGLVEVDGRQLLVMELVEGPSLAQVIARDAPLAEQRLLRLARDIAAGLAHAHAAGIIHRDLKPANVLLGSQGSQEIAKIVDFGMARASSLAGVDRRAFTLVGTPDYMAPESIDALAVDPRSDLYALGCIMFEMATGAPPFHAATAMGLLEQHRRTPAPKLPSSCSAPLRALVDALLAKSPADRPQAASTVVATLDHLLSGADALVLAKQDAGVNTSSCAACGQRLVPGLGVCMNCGLETAKFEAGEWTLLVSGPGEVGDKIDTRARERLIAWIRANPGLAMDVGPLAKEIPRLPFCLISEVSQACGQSLAGSLEHLGLETELVRGRAFASPAMKQKVKQLSGRVIAIMMASVAGLAAQLSWGLVVVIPLAMLIAGAVTFRRSTKRLTAPRSEQQLALPAAVERSLGAVERVVPAIEQGRHRHGLRAVVERALRLGTGADEDTGHELGAAIELAAVAAARLDELDRGLAAQGFDEASPEARKLLHERDTWAARLLDLTAQLDALAARLAAARVQVRGSERLALDDLRALVEGLEQVQGKENS